MSANSLKLSKYVKFKYKIKKVILSFINNVEYRKKRFTRFRTSCHQLIIETGRYKKIPVVTLCNMF